MNDEQQSDRDDEQIEVVGRGEDRPWRPAIGRETLELLGRVQIPEGERPSLRDEAVAILSRCIPPSALGGQQTGLVLGYVQSGKTLSFTTVAALARDSGYPIVIVIAGTSIPLTEQSRQRLRADLDLESRSDRSWRHLHNPRLEDQDHVRIADALEDWRDPEVPDSERCTTLVTVMKHHRHLNNLIDVLRQVALERMPVLIIDDEADQAGLNNLINQGQESTTYGRLRTLKSVIPHHTFLQYTATPQGPLLINLIDILSPGFAQTLTPGADYVGGRDFFLDQRQLLRIIPPDQIPNRDAQLEQPPESLLDALRVFFLGIASGWIRDGGAGNRAMMVHPSQRTVGHETFFNWVRSIREAWLNVLQNSEDPDYAELRADFERAYEDLRSTVLDLEPFEDLFRRMRRAIRRTDIHLVNATAGRTPEIDWRGAYSHILVGGQALDRGFTVEGLTITYMPRGVGARRADTIQQRARFFGYKRRYLGYCRVYLEQEVANSFARYVAHEEDIRRQLTGFEGRSLDELRRTFLLPRGLYATRDSIVDVDYVRARFNEGWFYPRAPHDSPEALRSNRETIDRFLETVALEPDPGHADRTQIQHHMMALDLPLQEVYEQLLLGLRFTSLSDAQNLLGVLVILRKHLADEPDARCALYQMSSGEPRIRSINARGDILNLFQGAAPVSPPDRRGEVYPGDRQIKADAGVTVQLHNLNIRNRESREIEIQDVPTVAIWIPREIAAAGDVLVQDQGGELDFTDE